MDFKIIGFAHTIIWMGCFHFFLNDRLVLKMTNKQKNFFNTIESRLFLNLEDC